jgi:NTE family protein
MVRCSPEASGRTDRDPLLVDLALQGGGSHGALTRGVIERLLEESSLKIESITGTSAGAMNAAVLAYGYTALENFWRRVSEAARFSPIQRAPLDIFMGNWTLDNSPATCSLIWPADCSRLTISIRRTTIRYANVRTGLPRMFRNEQMHANVLLASACLPSMHQTVEIDGDAYWDVLTPIIRENARPPCLHKQRAHERG